MKFLGTILSAAALLASGISALPAGKRGTIETRASLLDYNIDTVIANWMSDTKTRKRLTNNSNTVGGWEGWAQSELEDEFKEAFGLSMDIREQGGA